MGKFWNKLKLFKSKLLLKTRQLLGECEGYFKFKLLGKSFPVQDNCIVFCGTVMHARIARLAKWELRTNNNKTYILICKKTEYSSLLSNHIFHETYLYNSRFELSTLLRSLDFDTNVFHIFGPPYDAAELAVDQLQNAVKVYDYQDLLVTNFGLQPPFKYMKEGIKKEAKVLARVDGIVCNSLELQTAKKYYSDIAKKRLYFPNYVDPDQFDQKTKRLNDEIHLVYIGSVHSMYRNKDYFGGQQLHWFIRKMNRQKIHIHIYPAPTNLKAHLVDYYEMDEELEYFHLHQSVPQGQLKNELKNYDFGVIPFFHRTNKKLDDKRYYSTALKLFNYFEAGMPVILGEDTLFQNHIGKTYGASISASWEDFDNLSSIIGKYDYAQLIQNLEERRENYTLPKYVSKMFEFYSSVKSD